MLIVVAALIGILAVPLFRGRFENLATIRLRWGWALAAALGLQVAITSLLSGIPVAVAQGLHLGSYALAATFLFGNRRLVGLWCVAVGAALNVLVISLNQGVMPASGRALEVAGVVPAAGRFANSAPVRHPRFAFLGDIFAIPSGYPFANVFSVGDVIIVVGAVLTIHHLCGSRLLPWTHRQSFVTPPR